MSTPTRYSLVKPVGINDGKNVIPVARIGNFKSTLLDTCYFKAYGTTNGISSFTGDIKLNAVDINESCDSYNITTGIFTAPVKGLYKFEVCTTNRNVIFLKLNNQYVLRSSYGFNTDVYLQKNDQIKIVCNTTIECTAYTLPFKVYNLINSTFNIPKITFGGRLLFEIDGDRYYFTRFPEIIDDNLRTVTGIFPASGSTNGNTLMIISGTNFTGDEIITIGGNLATDVTLLSSTQLQCRTPVGTEGIVDVIINDIILHEVFTYTVPVIVGSKSRYRTFTTTTIPSGVATYFHDVTWSSELSLFIAVAQFSSSNDGIMTSPNGTTWTRRTAPFTEGGNTYLRVIAGGSRVLTSGDDSGGNIFSHATSTDGITWTSVTSLTTGKNGLAYSPLLSRWVVPALNGFVYYSSDDTVSWLNTPTSIDPASIIWVGNSINKFFIFPRESGGTILYSSDGISWTSVNNALYDADIYYASASNGNVIVTIGVFNRKIYLSPNGGTTWLEAGVLPIIEYPRSIVYSSEVNAWYVSGYNGVAVSQNCTQWSIIASHTTDEFYDYTMKGITYSPTLDKFVSTHGSIYVSDQAKRACITFNTNCYITYTNSVDFQFGTGDFTIEWFSYQTSLTGTQRLFSYGNKFAIQITDTKNLQVIINGSIIFNTLIPDYDVSLWKFFSISRQSNNLRVTVGGNQFGSTVVNSTDINDASTVFCIGNESTPNAGSSFIGKMTSIRIVKGVGLYPPFVYDSEPITYPEDVLLLPCPSTNFIKDYSSKSRVATNNGCTMNISTPYS